MALDSISSEEPRATGRPAPGNVIVVEDLWRTYDMGSEQQVQALRGISMTSSTMSMWPSWAPPAPASPRS